jgi:hypothetical protein
MLWIMALRSWHVRWCTAVAAGCAVLCLAVPSAEAKSRHRQAAPHPQAVKAKVFTGPGFDACHAPPLPAMTAWWGSSGYQAVGIYIGGQNRACADGDLSDSWVRSAARTGWRLVPIYVGLQAPCARQPHLKLMDPKTVADQANSAADDAVNQAAALGMVRGSAVYFDLEAYPRKDPACAGVVLNFLSAWTKRVHTHGYFSGLYASAGSGITDLAAANLSGLVPPDALWIARWDNAATVQDPAVPDGSWSPHQRIKQFAGGHKEAHGGVTLNIDKDYLDGPIARIG